MKIYSLEKNGVVVYVGKTKDLNRRISEHKDKIFDSYSYFDCPESISNEVEDELIIAHDPIYNRSLNSKGEYKNLVSFCKKKDLDLKVASEIIRNTPYIEPIFNDNYSPHSLSVIKTLLRGEYSVKC